MATKGTFVRHTHCDKCGSSDAKALYSNGSAFCFKCGKYFKSEEEEVQATKIVVNKKDDSARIDDILKLPFKGMASRKITKEIFEFFEVRSEVNEDGSIKKHFYPYGNDAFKVRTIEDKRFQWINNSTTLFGMDKFQQGGRRLIITEGELDAMSVAQACLLKYDKIFPVISLQSATGKKSFAANRDWIMSFGEIILFFDQDEAGKEALEYAIKALDISKLKIVESPEKDASDMLVKHGVEPLYKCIWEAHKYVPAGFISKDEIWKRLVEYNEKPSIKYPPCLEGINTKTKGYRDGEIDLFISGTGSGKSTLIREIILSALENTDRMVGVMALEESPEETVRKLVAMKLCTNPVYQPLTPDEMHAPYQELMKDDRLMLLDHQGAISDIGSIASKLEYMALMGCKSIFIDHITMLVSEGTEELTGNEATDKIMNMLLRFSKKHNVHVGVVSHLRKAPNGSKSFEEGKIPSVDDIRGSGSIKQVSHTIIAFARNLVADTAEEQNVIKISILKCRFTGLTGAVRGSRYIPDTGRLEMNDESLNEISSLFDYKEEG